MSWLRRRLRFSARGQVIVLVALMMTVLIAVTGVAVDYGFWLVNQRDLRAAADAAAQAGASEISQLPITTAKRSAAAQHAMQYLNDDLALGLSASQIPTAASDATSADGFLAGAQRIRIRTPSTSTASCTGQPWGVRSITVRINRETPRFFSRVFFGDEQTVSGCATSAVKAMGYAVAVLKPAPSDNRTQVPNAANITLKFAGTDSFVRVCGGDVAVNALFNGGPAPPPTSPVTPAHIKFLKPNSDTPCMIDQENKMVMRIDQPSPQSWSESSKQIRTEGASSILVDDVYLPPEYLTSRVDVPTWGAANYAALVVALSSAPVWDVRAQDDFPGPTPTCTAPDSTYTEVGPGKYTLLQSGTATGQHAKRWLCPGVYYFVHKPTGSQGLDLGSGTVIAGDGVTLVFEADASGDNSAIRISGGAKLALNEAAEGPWRTGDADHDVAMSIWIRPIPACDPLDIVTGPGCPASSVFTMIAGSDIDVSGIVFGPTDNIKIAGGTGQSGAGELWAWTLEYLGGSQLNQWYHGPADGYPLLVE